MPRNRDAILTLLAQGKIKLWEAKRALRVTRKERRDRKQAAQAARALVYQEV